MSVMKCDQQPCIPITMPQLQSQNNWNFKLGVEVTLTQATFVKYFDTVVNKVTNSNHRLKLGTGSTTVMVGYMQEH